MASIDFGAEWDVIKAYLESASAANLAAITPSRPVVKRGQIEWFEDLVRPYLIAVDMSGSDQQRDKASGNNLHQEWGSGFRLYAAARGTSMSDADDKCLDIVSAIANDLAGTGGFVGTARTTLVRAVVDRWFWDEGLGDDLISVAVVEITGHFYRI